MAKQFFVKVIEAESATFRPEIEAYLIRGHDANGNGYVFAVTKEMIDKAEVKID